MTRKTRILVADDQQDVQTALRMLLVDEGYHVETVSSPAEALAALARKRFDLLLMDLNYARDTTSGEVGLKLIGDVRAQNEVIPIVVMTAFSNVEIAVQTMQQGAQDFIEKPWDNYRLVTVVRAQLALAGSQRRSRQLEAENEGLRRQDSGRVIAASPSMVELMQTVEQIADADVSVLITGENGVGKGVIARAIHRASGRAEAPLVTVDMGTLGAGVLESELFGHEAGAFTDAKSKRVGRFELADGGTLFLDEIGNFPADHQAKLLRVLETGEFERVGSSVSRKTDVRLLCATNVDLAKEVREGRFRQDLYYRLHTVEVSIPPLRERAEDIVALSDQLLERFADKYRRTVAGFASDARKAMEQYSWPGNVRELSHAVERAVLMSRGSMIGSRDLRLVETHTDEQLGWERWPLEKAERFMICRAIARTQGNVSEAATQLGLSRSALYRRLERFELTVEAAFAEGKA